MWNWIKALDRILKGEATRLPDLRQGRLDVPLGGLSIVILLLGAIYGVCMGAFAIITRHDTETAVMGYQQAFASAVKVPALFFLTLLVTFPSLYVFNALVGSRLSFATVLRLLVASMGVMMALLASFGTIVVFFAISTTSYAFMVLLNVALFAVSGFLGLGFLLQTLHRMTVARSAIMDEVLTAGPTPMPEGAVAAPPGDVPVPPLAPEPYSSSRDTGALEPIRGYAVAQNVRAVFRIWVLVFGLVGAQMGWVLRPFIGNPDVEFEFFRKRESNFFQAVTGKVGELFDWDNNDSRRR